MTVDAGEFIGKLRDKLALKLDASEMAAFDRACVEALVEEHNGQARKNGLSPQQKGARTRAKHRAEMEEAARAAEAQGVAE